MSDVRRDPEFLRSRQMTIFTVALISGLVACVSATILAIRLPKTLPFLHQSVDTPSGTERWPFWVFHFISPIKWRQLPAKFKPLALVAMLGLAIDVALLTYIVFRFAASGGNL